MRPRYEVLGPLARGGMGTVWLALREEATYRRLYAIKRLRDELRNDSHAKASFLDEARIAGLLRNTHIVSVVDYGEDADGPFLVMQLVEGVSFSRLIKDLTETGHLLEMQVACELVRQTALGLAAAHELRGLDGTPLGVVHRDVSPSNILVGFDGVVRVTDFGIARAAGREAHTSTGILKGKVGYLAPEVLRFHEPDARSDLFSLGVVLWELLTTKRLYPTDRGLGTAARAILEDPVPDLHDARPDAPASLVSLAFDLLAKEPEHRPASATVVARRLDDARRELAQEEGELDYAEWVERSLTSTRDGFRQWLADQLSARASRKTARRHRRSTRVAAMGASVLAVGFGLGVAVFNRTEDRSIAKSAATKASAVATIAPDASPQTAEAGQPSETVEAVSAPPETSPPRRRRRRRARPRQPSTETPTRPSMGFEPLPW